MSDDDTAAPCAGNDPLCPCQDGDACHYRDAADGTRAFAVVVADAPATDAEGPRGTYGCACKSRNAAACHQWRCGIVAGDASHCAEECDCLCHQWSDDDDH